MLVSHVLNHPTTQRHVHNHIQHINHITTTNNTTTNKTKNTHRTKNTNKHITPIAQKKPLQRIEHQQKHNTM